MPITLKTSTERSQEDESPSVEEGSGDEGKNCRRRFMIDTSQENQAGPSEERRRSYALDTEREAFA
jgi:hypothetical protein